MTRTLVYSCALSALVTGSLAAGGAPPDCAQPEASDVQLASVAETPTTDSKPSPVKDAQLEIPFPPRIWDCFWLTLLCRRDPAAPPKQPVWFPLDAKVQQWVDDVLLEWERESAKVKYYGCTFQRWEFEPVFGPRDGKTPKTFATGTIKYQFPDKALFRVERLEQYVPPAEPGEKPNFVVPRDAFSDHWICDGKSVFELDHRRKALIKRTLPAELQGKAIGDGRFPFLFGRSAAAIKERYWIRPLSPPEEGDNGYWLQLWPRSATDAASIKYIVAVIGQSDMRLTALSVIPRNYDEIANPARVDYRFNNRAAAMLGTNWTFWEPEFFEPKTPLGWKRETIDLRPPTPMQDIE